MVDVELAEVTTRDGVPLAGIAVEPKGQKKAALIWVHGLSSAFYHGLPMVQELSRQCARRGYGYFKFNNRGHDIVARGGNKLIGVAFEDFKKCVEDIRAMIAFVRRQGYRRIILGGHSTGANKIVFYMNRTRDRRVKGLILAGGLSDIAADRKHNGKRAVQSTLTQAVRHVNAGRRNAIVNFKGKMFVAHRFVSLYSPGKAEDVFPVYDPKARWTAMKSVSTPMLVVFGNKDEHMDRTAQQLIDLYESKAVNVRQYSGVVIRGADHSFVGKEKQFAAVAIEWMNGIVAA